MFDRDPIPYNAPVFAISSQFEDHVLHEGCVLHIDGLDVVVSRQDLPRLAELCSRAAHMLADGYILDNFQLTDQS